MLSDVQWAIALTSAAAAPTSRDDDLGHKGAAVDGEQAPAVSRPKRRRAPVEVTGATGGTDARKRMPRAPAAALETDRST